MIDCKQFNDPLMSTKLKRDAETVPASPGQHSTTTNRDFTNKKVDNRCPILGWPELPTFGKPSGYYRSLDKVY